ncbi:hypothetical protein LPB72_03410 [Hydrogenophaga crassostreae]|uniref:Lipoprotein n=1 Tax=Hydrogenophaga crassostreae TaxID=1763535 RepID=A0A167IU25_9BURK|nr:hypothetical protein [Hydrogenophaga crassostreae]AOW14385.1 hypothetical protein LPB072_17625 [Hydrogenophaga crassostreae]OAD43590.1 hypothetical protein LPB72_03410 [Hydrogenophaga crassostreae]
MRTRSAWFPLATVCGLILAGCVTASPPNPRDQAVNQAWETYCNAGYCEGARGSIVERTDSTLTVSINGNVRYMTYTVSGGPAHYEARVTPTADQGRTQP